MSFNHFLLLEHKSFFSINHIIAISYSTVGRAYVLCPSVTALFSNDRLKSLVAPWKLGSDVYSKYGFCFSIVLFDCYLFQFIALLKPDYNCSSSFALSWVDKVATET